MKTAEEVRYIIHERFDGETEGKVAHSRMENSLIIVGASPTLKELTVWKRELEKNGGEELLWLYERNQKRTRCRPIPTSLIKGYDESTPAWVECLRFDVTKVG